MKILAINQYIPPDASPTARLLGDAEKGLLEAGHTVSMVGNPDGYRESAKGSRMVREARSLIRLLWEGCAAQRPDRVLCLTSPPMLPVVGALVAIRHRVPLIHWAMDIYPDVAVALGEVKHGSLLHRLTKAFAGWSYRRCSGIIALDKDMASVFQDRYGVNAEILPPWPPVVSGQNKPAPSTSGTLTWLYSGNLGRAHEWKTLLDAQKLIEESGHPTKLVFQGRGAERDPAEIYANRIGLKNVVWKDYADEKDLVGSLQNADAIVATQRPETLGCLWPSKLALASLIGNPLMWVGPAEGAVSQWIRSLPHGHTFEPDDSSRLADAITNLKATGLPDPTPAVAEARRSGITRLVTLVTSI